MPAKHTRFRRHVCYPSVRNVRLPLQLAKFPLKFIASVFTFFLGMEPENAILKNTLLTFFVGHPAPLHVVGSRFF